VEFAGETFYWLKTVRSEKSLCTAVRWSSPVWAGTASQKTQGRQRETRGNFLDMTWTVLYTRLRH